MSLCFKNHFYLSFSLYLNFVSRFCDIYFCCIKSFPPFLLSLSGLATSSSCSWIVGSSKFWFIIINAGNCFSWAYLRTYIVHSFLRILSTVTWDIFLLQFRPVVPTQQGQPFLPSASQQFRPVGQGFPSNAGIPAGQSQQLQFSQPIQQLHSRPNQPSHATPPSQAVQMQYVQTNRQHASIQQSAPPLTNHMPGLAGSGIPISSSYTVRNTYPCFMHLGGYFGLPFALIYMILYSSVCSVFF